MRPDDWPRVEEVFAQEIATGRATLDTETPSWEERDESHPEAGRLAAEGARGRGVGTRLFEKCGFRRVGVREGLGTRGDE